MNLAYFTTVPKNITVKCLAFVRVHIEGRNQHLHVNLPIQESPNYIVPNFSPGMPQFQARYFFTAKWKFLQLKILCRLRTFTLSWNITHITQIPNTTENEFRKSPNLNYPIRKTRKSAEQLDSPHGTTIRDNTSKDPIAHWKGKKVLVVSIFQFAQWKAPRKRKRPIEPKPKRDRPLPDMPLEKESPKRKTPRSGCQWPISR